MRLWPMGRPLICRMDNLIGSTLLRHQPMVIKRLILRLVARLRSSTFNTGAGSLDNGMTGNGRRVAPMTIRRDDGSKAWLHQASRPGVVRLESPQCGRRERALQLLVLICVW